MKAITLKMLPEDERQHARDVEEATSGVLRLARALQSAAFPERPPLRPLDVVAPLYLGQASAAFRDPKIRAELQDALRGLY